MTEASSGRATTIGRAAPHDRSALAHRLAWLACLAILGLGVGCNAVETNPDDAAASKREDATQKEPARSFAWPEDREHPILTLEIEAPSATGTIRIELMPELAPVSVARIVELAENGDYDGTTFHRVIPDFMIQGGDPNSRDRNPANDGRGRSGESLEDEFGPAPFVRGVVGLGNRGVENSTTSQLFIMQADNRSLDGRYTVIGRVVSGMEVVDTITRVEIDRLGRWGPKDRPIENVVMKTVAVETPTVVDAIGAKTGSPPDAKPEAAAPIDDGPALDGESEAAFESAPAGDLSDRGPRSPREVSEPDGFSDGLSRRGPAVG